MTINVYARADAVLLSLDPAKGKSGASIFRPDMPQPRLVTASVVTAQSERDAFVAGAKEIASRLQLPLIVIAEEWNPPIIRKGEKVDKNWNYPTILGIGEGWGKWTAEFERHGISELDVVRVKPTVWRHALFGKILPPGRDALKRLAVDYIKTRLRVELPPDAAEASCIGLWALHSVEVHTRIEIWLKKNRRKSSA